MINPLRAWGSGSALMFYLDTYFLENLMKLCASARAPHSPFSIRNPMRKVRKNALSSSRQMVTCRRDHKLRPPRQRCVAGVPREHTHLLREKSNSVFSSPPLSHSSVRPFVRPLRAQLHWPARSARPYRHIPQPIGV